VQVILTRISRVPLTNFLTAIKTTNRIQPFDSSSKLESAKGQQQTLHPGTYWQLHCALLHEIIIIFEFSKSFFTQTSNKSCNYSGLLVATPFCLFFKFFLFFLISYFGHSLISQHHPLVFSPSLSVLNNRKYGKWRWFLFLLKSSKKFNKFLNFFLFKKIKELFFCLKTFKKTF
jgi:hypothetical protein